MSNYPTTGPTTRFPPADQRDYDPPVEWIGAGIVPARQPTSRDNTLIAIVIGAALLLLYMAKSGAYAEYRAAPPLAEPPPPAITIVDNSWNVDVCGICTRGNASPHFEVNP